MRLSLLKLQAYSVYVVTRQALLELISANQILELKLLYNDIWDLHLCLVMVLL